MARVVCGPSGGTARSSCSAADTTGRASPAWQSRNSPGLGLVGDGRLGGPSSAATRRSSRSARLDSWGEDCKEPDESVAVGLRPSRVGRLRRLLVVAECHDPTPNRGCQRRLWAPDGSFGTLRGGLGPDESCWNRPPQKPGAVSERAGLGGSAASLSLSAARLDASGPEERSDDVEEVRALAGLGAPSIPTQAEGGPWRARLQELSESDCDDATARQVCHAPGGDEMTVALETLVHDVDLSPTPGISLRACRAVFRCMARVANDEGEFRYGMRQCKVAALADYSMATIKRVQRFLVDHGLLERVAVGGGRRSTRWRICVDRLRPAPAPTAPPRASSQPTLSRQPARAEPAQERRGVSQGTYSPSGPAEVITEVCEHGHRAGLMPTKGLPWCPVCRRINRKRWSLRR